MLQLKAYVNASGKTFTGKILGTMKDLTKGLKLNFLKANFSDTTKRVVLIARNDANESILLTCSEQVSKLIRANQLSKSQLAACQVIEGENGGNFIALPGNTGGFSLDGVTPEAVSNTFIPA